MSVKSSLITHLTGVAGLSALVGSRVGFSRVSHGDALPYIVANQVSGDHKHHMTAATGIVVGRFQFDCYGASLLEATNVAEQLRLALDGKRGTVGDVFFSSCHLADERDGFENPSGGEQDGISSVQQDYMIGWTVSVPSF